MLHRAFCFIFLPIYYHQLPWGDRKSKTPSMIPVVLALSKIKDKPKELQRDQNVLYPKSGWEGLTYSEHLSCFLTASLCLCFCTDLNWQVLILSCPQEKYEDYSVFLKDEQRWPYRPICDFSRAEKLAGLFCWQLE